MKRLSLILTVIALGTVTAVFSQNESRENTREEVKQYIDKNVYPLIEKQQTMYLKKLSDTEKTELNTLKEKISERKTEFAGKRQNNLRKDDAKKNTKKMGWLMRPELSNDIKKITDAHPKLNDSYKEFIDSNKQKWISDIEAIHAKNNVEQMRNKNGNMGIDVFFVRASNPDWLLLWDPSNPRLTHTIGMKSRENIKSNRKMEGKKQRNPELRAEISAFATENILPVITEERKRFDKQLNDSEKKIIEKTRQEITLRKEMFKKRYQSEDFVPGECANDPKFEGMRTEMRNSMAEVREIAIAHSAEIRESTNKIRSNVDEWEKSVTTITENNNQDADVVLRMVRQQLRKSITPVSFLLFNPDKADSEDFFDDFSENEVKVIVYPNPIVHSATIAVIGAADKTVHVTLFTKDGEALSTLFSGLNNEQRLEIALNSTELSNDVYIIKVVAGDVEISRKIAVKH
ncbi:MAG: T9SS type A sorting domain-containing protein [Bacteroidetes bacterium]|nr:T9SS type A sorting domain-containing protein [Bacteroidota bacterium]MBL6942777.1 T9SS type A sorting domain-containing protein [Bacteroidales bacterium]